LTTIKKGLSLFRNQFQKSEYEVIGLSFLKIFFRNPILLYL
jgi:hypothetical protein